MGFQIFNSKLSLQQQIIELRVTGIPRKLTNSPTVAKVIGYPLQTDGAIVLPKTSEQLLEHGEFDLMPTYPLHPTDCWQQYLEVLCILLKKNHC